MTSVCGGRMVTYVSGFKTLLHRVTSTRAISAAAISAGKHSVRPRDTGPSRAPGRGVEPLGPLNPMDCHLEALASMNRGLPTAPPAEEEAYAQVEEGGGCEFFDVASVECALQPCPQRLAPDVALMFPEAPPARGVMVVTVTQRTQQDMSVWNPSVEAERERLLQVFISGAAQICSELQREGHWADFIDPSSGLPFWGPYTNLPLFETDERWVELGFSIEDLGCCRVLRHILWGTHVFVGAIFTTADPQKSRVMEALQERAAPEHPGPRGDPNPPRRP